MQAHWKFRVLGHGSDGLGACLDVMPIRLVPRNLRHRDITASRYAMFFCKIYTEFCIIK